MADEDMLSDDEIEALLEEEGEQEPSTSDGEDDVALFSAYEDIADTLANTYETILTTDVETELVSCQVADPEALEGELEDYDRWVLIEAELGGDLEGTSRYLLPEDLALSMGDLMMGQEGEESPDEIDEVYEGAIREMFNQVVNTTVNELSDRADAEVNLEPLESSVVTDEELIENLNGESLVQVVYNLTVGDIAEDTPLIELQPSALHELLMEAAEEEAAEQAQPEPEPEPEPDPEPQPSGSASGGGGQQSTGTADDQKEVKSVDFQQLDETEKQQAVGNMNLLIDVPMEVSVELGRTSLKVKEILNLSQGSIIELERLAGEPVDLLVNGRLVARGEVVVIDENFGVRVTAIVEAMERLQE